MIRLPTILLSAIALVGLLFSSIPANAQPTPTSLYLPLVRQAAGTSVFGIETRNLSAEQKRNSITALGARWLRQNAVRWREIEPTRGQPYFWESNNTRQREADMRFASQMGLNYILIIQGSPAWSTVDGGDCRPIKPEHYADFARFLVAVVERYSQPPFNVRYIEIGNEPDAFLGNGPVSQVYGCWGDPNDPFYGGRAYGEMLNVVYPAIKAANPNMQVLSGGLLLGNLDPNETSNRFFAGILEAGAGASVDIVAYHNYNFFNLTADGNDFTNRADQKVPFLREVMARYGVDKPLFNTESALLCAVGDTDCHQFQGYAVPRLFVRTLRDDIIGLIWYLYDSDQFRFTSLVNPATGEPRPAYRSYQFAAQQLTNARFVGQVAGMPLMNGSQLQADGYHFTQQGRNITVLWANQPWEGNSLLTPVAPFRLAVQGTPACYEYDGTPFECPPVENGVMTIELLNGARYIVTRP